VATCLLIGLTVPLRVTAQSSAQAVAASKSAETLTQKALECLNRGEDAGDPQQRLAAYREGLGYAEAAVEADDESADAHFAVFANRGRIMFLEGVIANPFNLYVINRELKRTLELNPDHADGLAAKGGMLRKLPRLLGGDLAEAAKYLERSIALDPSAVGARMELAEIYRDLGEPERGIPYLEKAAEMARRDGKLGRLAEIETQLQQLRSPRPDGREQSAVKPE